MRLLVQAVRFVGVTVLVALLVCGTIAVAYMRGAAAGEHHARLFIHPINYCDYSGAA